MCTITLQIENIRTKVNAYVSVFIDLTAACPTRFNFIHSFIQHLHLRSLFYSTFKSTIFFFFGEEHNVTSYADDTTPYSNGKNVVAVLENIETKGKEVFSWFSMNDLKANPYKSQLLLTSKDEASLKIDETNIKSSSSKKLWGF